jgi:hypothetical protein
MATQMGLKHRQQLHKIESKKDVSVDEFVAYTTALGLKPGDLLENSGGVRSDLRPLIDEIEKFRPTTLARARDLLRLVDAVAAEEASTATAPTEVAGRILRQLSGMSPDMQEQAAQIFEVGVGKFLQSHLNGEASSARA